MKCWHTDVAVGEIFCEIGHKELSNLFSGMCHYFFVIISGTIVNDVRLIVILSI